KNAVQLNKFDYRLANRLDTDLQKLRCRVNYHALQFANPILEMGKILVRRLRMRSKHYIALHLMQSSKFVTGLNLICLHSQAVIMVEVKRKRMN
ncbi:hypothetical protein Godav_013534, partial [Gossypium davidsonii]|nr:hypothetical protein [Gossypium davidsonii]